MYHDISRITPRARKYRDLLDSIAKHTSSRHKPVCNLPVQNPWARFCVNAQAWMMRTYDIPRCSHFGNKIRPCFELPSKHKLSWEFRRMPSYLEVLPQALWFKEGRPALLLRRPCRTTAYRRLNSPTSTTSSRSSCGSRRWWQRERGPNCGGLESLQCPSQRLHLCKVHPASVTLGER